MNVCVCVCVYVCVVCVCVLCVCVCVCVYVCVKGEGKKFQRLLQFSLEYRHYPLFPSPATACMAHADLLS